MIFRTFSALWAYGPTWENIESRFSIKIWAWNCFRRPLSWTNSHSSFQRISHQFPWILGGGCGVEQQEPVTIKVRHHCTTTPRAVLHIPTLRTHAIWNHYLYGRDLHKLVLFFYLSLSLCWNRPVSFTGVSLIRRRVVGGEDGHWSIGRLERPLVDRMRASSHIKMSVREFILRDIWPPVGHDGGNWFVVWNYYSCETSFGCCTQGGPRLLLLKHCTAAVYHDKGLQEQQH